jgi:hypothetical protein
MSVTLQLAETPLTPERFVDGEGFDYRFTIGAGGSLIIWNYSTIMARKVEAAFGPSAWTRADGDYQAA